MSNCKTVICKFLFNRINTENNTSETISYTSIRHINLTA